MEVLALWSPLITASSNIQLMVGRVSRTGVPDRFCLLTTSHEFSYLLPNSHYLIQGNERVAIFHLKCAFKDIGCAGFCVGVYIYRNCVENTIHF